MKKLLFAFLLLASLGFAQTTCVNCGGGISANPTSNVVPKSAGANANMVDSSITDDGTTATTTERFVGPTSNSVPQISDTATNGSGWAINGANVFGKSGTSRIISITGTSEFRLGNALAYTWSSNGDAGAAGSDTGMSRKSAAVVAIGTGAQGSVAGFFKSGQTLQVITSNFTTSATTLATAGVITGLSFTAPVSSAYNFSYRCDLVYSQATAAAANLWGITTSGTAPTSMLAAGEVDTSLAGAQVDGTAVITTATSTTVVTATPSAAGAIGTTADMFTAHIWGTVEAPSNATPTTFGIAAASGNASDALTIYRGSACWVY